MAVTAVATDATKRKLDEEARSAICVHVGLGGYEDTLKPFGAFWPNAAIARVNGAAVTDVTWLLKYRLRR